MEISPGTIVGGKYRLEKPLSRGGMGAVWVARHAKLGSPVAVKFMDPSFASSAEFVARFEREARIAANLQNPHVVVVQDYGIDEGVPYLVMELLQGESLAAHLRRVGRMPLADAVRVLAQVAKALRRAHQAGLVHRDLKPANIFLARAEDDEVVKVLDFGIVKETGSEITGESTRTGELLGSPNYMSPEQARGKKDLDHRSDLWSLGVILFHAVTGEQPFASDQVGDVLAKIIADPIPKAIDVAPDLPAEIDDFFTKALARDRTERFQSVDEMTDALRRIAGVAPPTSAPSQPQPAAPARVEAPITSTPKPDPGATVSLAARARAEAPTLAAPEAEPEDERPAASTLTSASAVRSSRSEIERPSRARLVIGLVAALVVLGVGAAMLARSGGGGAEEAAAPAAEPPPESTEAPAPAAEPAPIPTAASEPPPAAAVEQPAVQPAVSPSATATAPRGVSPRTTAAPAPSTPATAAEAPDEPYEAPKPRDPSDDY